MTFFEVEY